MSMVTVSGSPWSSQAQATPNSETRDELLDKE
jgi:hypothetical protein